MSDLDYASHLASHRRLTILRLLDRSNERFNDSVITTMVSGFGIPCDRASVKDDIRFLEKLHLVTVKTKEHLLLAMITNRGRKVVLGDEVVDGVQQPGQV